MNTITYYTDASYSPPEKFAVIGYMCVRNEEDENLNPKDLKINFEIIENTTNTEAEIIGIISVLKSIKKGKDSEKSHTIYTDCESVLGRIKKKNQLIQKNFKTKTNKDLNNSSLYKELFELIEGKEDLYTFHHIDGHITKKLIINTANEKHHLRFSEVDKKVRKILRKEIKENPTKGVKKTVKRKLEKNQNESRLSKRIATFLILIFLIFSIIIKFIL